MRPTVGRVVHYRSYGTPGGEYASECRAAVVSGISSVQSEIVHLAVLNPEGMFFNQLVEHDEDGKAGGTWHWPERVEETS